MNEWKIQSNGSRCVQCEKSFEDKQPYRTLLFESDEELQRYDICLGCWKTNGDSYQSEGEELISNWKGRYKKPPPRPKEAIQKDQAEAILLQLVEERDEFPVHPGTLYILSAMLERKKHLKLRDTVHKNQKRLFVYEHAPSGDVFTIEDVKLTSDEWAIVYQEVSGVLTSGLEYFSESDPTEGDENLSAEPHEDSDLTSQSSTDSPDESISQENSSGGSEENLENLQTDPLGTEDDPGEKT